MKLSSLLYLWFLITNNSCEAKKNKVVLFGEREPHNNYFVQMQLLLAEIYRLTKIKRCFAVVTDNYHEDIFRSKFFQSSRKYYSNFFLKILESEDMMSPNYRTIKNMQEIRKNDCDLIFLLILNGIQVERFLTFMDDKRILNTRAKFVMLYDHRILSSKLHYIWRKVIRVVFIRKMGQTTINSGDHKLWFEILTVPYPNILNNTFVGKRINTWVNERFTLNNKIFSDKTKNLQKAVIKTIVLEHIPTVFRVPSDQNQFSGMEIHILSSLANVMNFTPEFYETAELTSEKWGRLLLNGTYTGLIGEMVNGYANIALGGLHFTPFYLELMDLSTPHSTACLTFLTPESSTDNSWKTLILPFKKDMWIGLFVSLFSVGTIFYILSQLNMLIVERGNTYFLTKFIDICRHPRKNMRKFLKRTRPEIRASISLKPRKPQLKLKSTQWNIRKPDIFDDFSNCILLTFSMLLQVSLPRMPINWPLRLLTGWYWIYCILVVVAYRASFTAILANPSPRITFDTLEELANSNIIVGAWGEQNKEFFNSAFDEAARKIGAKLEQVDDSNTAVDRIVKGTYAYYDNEYYLRLLRLARNSKEGEEVLHIMKECVVNMPISIGLEKNSPLKPAIDHYLRGLIEGGLIDKWLRDSTVSLNAEEEPPQEALMDLKKFSSSFVALGVGYLLSILAIICEKIHFKYVVEKHPMYNKYNRYAYYEFMRNRYY